MASTAAIAEMDAHARRDLTAAMAEISAALGVEEVVLPVYRGDPIYQNAAQLKALAAWSQQVALAAMELSGADVSGYQRSIERNAVDYLSVTDEDLRADAVTRGIEGAEQMARNDLVYALRQHDYEYPDWEASESSTSTGSVNDYSVYRDEQLRVGAAAVGIKGYQTLERAALIQALLDYDANPPPPDYKRMNKAQLVDFAVQRGLDVDEANTNTKAELADWLLASDGVSEDEQAAADTESE